MMNGCPLRTRDLGLASDSAPAGCHWRVVIPSLALETSEGLLRGSQPALLTPWEEGKLLTGLSFEMESKVDEIG